MTVSAPHQIYRPAIATLSDFERIFLQFISIVYEPVSNTFLADCFLKTNILDDGRRPGKDELYASITKFHELKLLNQFNQPHADIVEYLIRASIDEGNFSKLAGVIEQEIPVSYLYGKWSTRCWRALREFRIGVYSGDFDKIDDAQQFINDQCLEHFDHKTPAVLVAADNFDPKWFGTLPSSLQFFLLDHILRYSLEQLRPITEVIQYLSDPSSLKISELEQVPFHRMLAGHLIYMGRFDLLQQLLTEYEESFLGSGFAGTLTFLKGDTQKALELFEHDLKQLKEFFTDENVFFVGITGVFYLFALLTSNKNNSSLVLSHLSTVLTKYQGSPEETSFRFIEAVVNHSQGVMPDMVRLTEKLVENKRSLTTLFALTCLHWLGVEIPGEYREKLIKLHKAGLQSSLDWLAMEAGFLLSLLGDDYTHYKAKAVELHDRLHCRSITEIFVPQNSWKQSLQELINVSSQVREPERTNRLAWFVEFIDNSLRISCKEQKKTASGKWSKGRSVSLNRLMKNPNLEFLSNQDRKICSTLRDFDEESGSVGTCFFDMDKALVELIGHPHVFLESSPSTPVELVAGEPELMVEQQGESLFICFTQDIGEGNIAIWRETPTRFRIMQINEEHRKVAAITGREGLRVPMEASDQVLDAISKIASFMTVHTSIDIGTYKQQAEVVEPDSTVHIHIIPYGSGFRLEMFVQPFSNVGPYLKPGSGVATLFAEIDGRRMQTKRDLKLEENKAREVEESCPILDLAIDMEKGNEREWHLLDPEECLQTLLELEEIREKIVLEWPEGEKISIRRQAGVNQLNLNIRTSQQDWFTMSGHVLIDQDEVISLKSLLEKVKKANSRFIPLEDGQFLALTQEFRKRLDELIIFGDTGPGAKKDEILIHPLAGIALDGLTQKAQVSADEGWKKQVLAIENIQDLVPVAPSTLQAELRDYQAEGFVWMARLGHLGIGACLADDMGLGKTLQAITTILYRAKDKPTLVIAPTSVCMNWEQEVTRFAPTLTVRDLNGPDRKETIKDLGKFDLLITSYTLLQQEIDLLSEVEWQTVVLDEAQAIKNAATKRSKAAMRLNAEFRLITTGTPIENHLGELWNLFRFINPGLLGSYKKFNTRFGIPIEKHQDREARRQLKKLIQPFMLRRIKSQVLDELPPRTEITLRVEMSPQEQQFYEAIRQQAIENIEGNSEKPGRHLQILAEIMRLRRACCNPKLIDPQTSISSTKLEVFAEVLDELLESRHKALVFSQFTAHLALIREHLDKQGISYKYLDGTTPAKDRQRQVDAFQSGEGDVFLISLKAGGLGLNLTAADYVLHMDPWWNPAVEDQAADRAHRIGQKRPVTVYRLVTTNTIEEKIVRLHQEKRDLANSLLEGTDVSAKISVDELLQLIRNS